jgi:hypothetical protein
MWGAHRVRQVCRSVYSENGCTAPTLHAFTCGFLIVDGSMCAFRRGWKHPRAIVAILAHFENSRYTLRHWDRVPGGSLSRQFPAARNRRVNYSHRSPQGNGIRGACCVRLPGRQSTPGRHSSPVCLAPSAVAHRIAEVIRLVLHNGVDYQEKGSAPPNERTLLRKFRRLVKDFGHLGVDVRALLNHQPGSIA